MWESNPHDTTTVSFRCSELLQTPRWTGLKFNQNKTSYRELSWYTSTKINKRLLKPVEVSTVPVLDNLATWSTRNAMNDFPVIGYPCFAHRILGSPGGKHCESVQRNVWRGVVSPLKAVSLDIEKPHFAVILWETEVTNVGALKFQVSVWLMR